MFRHAIITAALLGTSGPLSAQPGLIDQRELLYYPTTIGDTWVFNRQNSTVTSVVIGVEKRNDDYLVNVQRWVENKGDKEIYNKYTFKTSVSRSGIYAVELNGKPLDPPDCSLKLSAKKGEEWLGLSGMKRIAGEPEDVVVPAGKFRAIPVRGTITPPNGQKRVATEWYAPGVGHILTTWENGNEKVVMELIEFRSGNNQPSLPTDK